MTDVVLIGYGTVAQRYHAPALRECESMREVRVVGLVDPDPASLAQLGTTFPDAACLRSLASLHRLDANLAIIASPPRLHASQAIRALRARMSVLCEKPMAVSTEEGRAMADAATEAEGVLAIGLIRRFLPAAQTIRTILRHGLLGEVLSFSGFEGGPFRWPIATAAYFTREHSAGGVLSDIGSHALDLLLWWLGEPEAITYEDDAVGGLEVNCRVQMRWPGGATGDLRLSREWARPNEYLIRCTGGWLRWQVNEADAVQMGLGGRPHVLDARILAQCGGSGNYPRATFERCFLEQIRDVAAAHRHRTTPFVTAEDGLRCLDLIERCYRQRTLMPMPWMNAVERDRARILAQEMKHEAASSPANEPDRNEACWPASERENDGAHGRANEAWP